MKRYANLMMTVCSAILVAAASAAAVSRAPDGLLVATNGKARCTIVVDKGASESERFAAEELQRFIKEISGAELPMAATAPAGRPAIIVGRGAVAAMHPGMDLTGLGDEGFVIKTVGNLLLIAGGAKRGTLYGLYSFLESLGCRWWYPGDSTIPKMTTIHVGPTDRREVPRLEFRDIMYGESHSDEGHLWNARNKLNGMAWGSAPAKWGGHYFIAGSQAHNSVDLAAAYLGELHDEHKALLADGSRGNEVCQTNPEVIAATIKSLVALQEANPETKMLTVSHEDNRHYCRCEPCAAIAKAEGSPSGQWWYFVNTVAEGLEKAVPGAWVMSSAYGWSQTPPKTIRPRKNVVVRFAPIGSDWAHPLAAASNEHNRRTRDDITYWGSAASKLFIWTYIGNRAHYLMPNPDLDAFVPNIKFYADHNAVGIMEQGLHTGSGSEFAPLRMWVQGRALWNPDIDREKVIDEFLDGYYGRAAPAIREYIEVMHRYGRENDFQLKRVERMDTPFLQPETIAEAEHVLREADRLAAGDADLERRVRHAHMPIWYVLAKRGPLSLTWRTTEERVGEKLDFAGIAAALNRVGKDYAINAVADPERSEPFFQWLTDYGKLVAARGTVLPPELTKADLATRRLLQARQIDSGWLARTGWWVPDAKASDGWALKVPTPQWLIQHHFSPLEECAGAKRFKLFIRARGGELSGDGNAFVCGTRGDVLEVAADKLADGEYHVFEVGEFDVTDDMMMYIALTRPSAAEDVYLDCLWLEPVE